MKQQSTKIKQEQPEHNLAPLDPPECNQPKLMVNQVKVDTANKNSIIHFILTLLGVARAISDQI